MPPGEFFRAPGVVRVVHVFHAIEVFVFGRLVRRRIRLGCDGCGYMCSGRFGGYYFYLLVFTENGRFSCNMDQNENGFSISSAKEDQSGNDDDRRHLLPADLSMNHCA